MKRIYLDNNASTFVDPQVADVVSYVLRHYPGNPSSPHHFGRESRSILIQAREVISQYLQVKPKEIVFTSGGTEGVNMIIKGIMSTLSGGHIITSNLEHSCVHSTIKLLCEQGNEATFLAPGMYGAVRPQDVQQAIRSDTRLIALMAVNNETGVKTDIEAIATIAENAGIPFLVDAVALFGKEYLQIPSGVSAMVFSGHKIHAPKGSGFVYVKSSLKFQPLLMGGEQENNRRGGTENLADIAGLAEAVKIMQRVLPAASLKMLQLREKFESDLVKELGDAVLFNGEAPRVCNTVNLSFEGVDGETLLAALDMEGIAASHGSACASGALEPSRVLLNMGMSLNRARGAIRFSLSRFTTEEEMDVVVQSIVRLVKKFKKS